MNRQDQDQDQQPPQRQPNRIRGPTSALSSFLREHGIRVENRSRRARREQAQEEEGAAEAAAAAEEEEEAAVPEHVASENDSSTASEPSTTALLYTPRRSGRRRLNDEAHRLIESARASSAKRKKKASGTDDDDSDGNETEGEPGPSSKPARPRRNQIVFCEKCKSRFARPLTAPAANVCPSCLAGKAPAKSVKRPVKRRRLESTTESTAFPSLQDICINMVAHYIEDVEAFGDIGPQNMEKIAKIISKSRKLTTQTIRLFLEPGVTELALHDCTKVDPTGLMNIAHFCPHLRSLKLIYCGQMTSDVLALYATHLNHLHSIELSGPFLVTDDAWIRFAQTLGDRLLCFKLSHSFRFDETCIEALARHCPSLQQLKLSRLVKMNGRWIEKIEQLTHLTSLELAWPDAKETIAADTLVKVLAASGHRLTRLRLPGCKQVNDDVLVKGILQHCPRLEALDLAECNGITSEGVQTLFASHPGKGLERLNVSRCLDVDDEALEAILRHSSKTLKHVNVHSLDKLSAAGLEMLAGHFKDNDASACKVLSTLNCSFVRAMDDFVLKVLVDACPSLTRLDVWGCNQLTNQINPASIRIVGRETEQ